MVWN